jgi:hypothetical protein
LDKRVANATRIPLEHIQFSSDSLQAVHYGVQQHYHSHHDYFDATLSPDAITAKNGQQRLLTLFWYLNDVEDGGQTVSYHNIFTIDTCNIVFDEGVSKSGTFRIWTERGLGHV